jgi:uncharacterized protein (DUF1778 family)
LIDNGAAISPDARKMIEDAASRAGMSVSEWLNEVILDAAADEGVKPARFVFKEHQATPTSPKLDLASIYSRLDDLAEKIAHLAQTEFAQAVSTAPLPQQG